MLDEVSFAAVVVVYEGRCPVVTAESMDEAVSLAHRSADGTGTVLLSPGCSSFDWYGSYDERGRDFQRDVVEGSDGTALGSAVALACLEDFEKGLHVGGIHQRRPGAWPGRSSALTGRS